MARSIAFVLPAILALAGFAQAQYDYYYPSTAPADGRFLVKSWYEHYLGREPDPGSLVWIHSLQTGHRPEQVLSTILSSQEYYLRAGGTRPSFIRKLYLDIAGRTPTEQELGYWMGRMRFDSRKDVAYQLLTFFAQNWQAGRGLATAPPPGYYPEPGNSTYRDPVAPYYRSPSYNNYEYRRPQRIYPLGP